MSQIREEMRFKDSLKALHGTGSGKLEPIRETSEHEDSPKSQGQVAKLPPISVAPSRTVLGTNTTSSLPEISPGPPKRLLALPPPDSGTDSDLEEKDDSSFNEIRKVKNSEPPKRKSSADSGISEHKGPQIRRIQRESLEMVERPSQRKARFSIDSPPPYDPPSVQHRVTFDNDHLEQSKVSKDPERRDSSMQLTNLVILLFKFAPTLGDSAAASDTSSLGGPKKRRRKRFQRFHQNNAVSSQPQNEKEEKVKLNENEELNLKNWGMAEDLKAVG